MTIDDAGIGIFRKICQELGLQDERHAVLELAKGKLTTDPDRHSGEGIFFSSRMFDEFTILSGRTFFSHKIGDEEDWLLEGDGHIQGTRVKMSLNNHTSRTTSEIFDQFATDEDYGFNKTVVPVRLAQYGDSNLVSRSQAKRLVSRVDRFHTVIFDFSHVPEIGQAFADEIFCVFALAHPEMQLVAVSATSEVEKMVRRAQGRKKEVLKRRDDQS